MKRSISAIVLCLSMMLCGCQEGGRTNRVDSPAGSDFEQSVDVGFNENEVSDSTASGESTSAVSYSSESTTISSISSSSSTVSIVPPVSTSFVSSSRVPQTTSAVSSPTISSEISKPPQSVPITDTSIDENAVPAIPEEPPQSSKPTPPEEIPIVSSSDESSDTLSIENTGIVYIAASGNGKRYHRSPSCSNMKGTVELDEQTALNRGYTPCKKCW